MTRDDSSDSIRYKAVINHEEQYSIWPADRENPAGWTDTGHDGSKEECLAYIKEVWTDMRPLSLRKKMAEAARAAEPDEPDSLVEPGPSLVERLCEGRHPVEVNLRPEKSVEALRKRIEQEYVHIKFTGTRGGTELGVRLVKEATDVTKADFVAERGSVHLVGELVLDYVPVRCIADVELPSLVGEGHLEVLGR